MSSDNPRGPRIAAAVLIGTFGALACLLVAAGLWFLAIPPAGAALLWAADMLRD